MKRNTEISVKACTCAAAHIQTYPDLIHYQMIEKVNEPCKKCPYTKECEKSNFPWLDILAPILNKGQFDFNIRYSD